MRLILLFSFLAFLPHLALAASKAGPGSVGTVHCGPLTAEVFIGRIPKPSNIDPKVERLIDNSKAFRRHVMNWVDRVKNLDFNIKGTDELYDQAVIELIAAAQGHNKLLEPFVVSNKPPYNQPDPAAAERTNLIWIFKYLENTRGRRDKRDLEYVRSWAALNSI
mgnify:CR=1 FL=1